MLKAHQVYLNTFKNSKKNIHRLSNHFQPEMNWTFLVDVNRRVSGLKEREEEV